jgi:hypothetical protein
MCSTACALPHEHVPAESIARTGLYGCVKDAVHAFSRCTPIESGQAAVLCTVEFRVDFSPTPAASQASARRTKKKSAMSTCTKALVGNMQQIQAILLYVLQDACQAAAPAAKPVGSRLRTLSTVCFRLPMKPSLDSTLACHRSVV